ncbi:ACP S-malonyltransferase [Sinanaerobacter chloroacetimidivorans]|jgi:[acyl-carrier-protein] S-malonyltransferase|uniref:Malonyl CoA-acyl carrier protein transacylase n=1 Tax=Sinanaerobacter chloroacetimidivorans TaxID=2818044 RepID=A0A8J7W049_9FIRM|nr:ACP S-malonyltransferase [Sinanaerobacter chloroacetimidivorans]MBR0597906.1 ACP S-malonyltransferase [Sinanaerobacter chloroacetimidivorans]
MKIGLLFAGQGAQYSGMGKSLYENTTEARTIFDQAGEEIKEWCFEGSKEILRQTNVTQPCIYTVTMAAYEAFLGEMTNLDEDMLNSITMQGMAGFSLGEYAALTAGGVIQDFQTGLQIVRQRGQWMSEAGKDESGESKGGMIAAFGDRHRILDCVEQSREDGILEGVNFNSPAQTVVAGDKDALERFKSKAKEMGHIKAVSLSVSTAFHSPMMMPMAEKLKGLLQSVSLAAPASKIYSNISGKDIMEGSHGDAGEWLADIMAKQAMSPVYWQEIIENMKADGVNLFIEIGPGNTLSGLVKKIDSELITMNVDDYDSLMKTINELRGLISAKTGAEISSQERKEGEGI